MKKIIFLVFFSFLFSDGWAQTEAGMKSLSGGLSLSSSSGSQGAFNASLYPSILFFVADNFAIGGSIQLAYSSSSAYWSMTSGIGPFAKLYFGTSQLKPFIQA